MRSGSKIAFAIILLWVIGLIGCSKGPGKGQKFDGYYYGHLSGVPEASIVFTISGATIEGSGELDTTYSWRPKGDPPHFTFTGTLSGRGVAITIPIMFEYNTSGYGDPPAWIDVQTLLTLTGRFNDSGACIGSFQGPNPINNNNPFTGTWSALRQSRGSGLTRSF